MSTGLKSGIQAKNQVRSRSVSGSIKVYVAVSLLILWVTALIAAYFVVHRPWPQEIILAPIRALFAIFLSLLMGGFAGGLGRKVLGSLPGLSQLEAMVIQAAMGFGLIGLATLFLGWIGLINRWVLFGSLLVCVILLRSEVVSWLQSWKVLVNDYHDSGRFTRITAWFVLIVVTFPLLQALAPPLKWDSLVYHLELPRRYVQVGRIGFIDDILFMGMPQQAEMLFAWGLALHSGPTAAVIGWVTGVIALAGVAGYARRILGPDASWIAPAILLTGSSISQGLAWGYVDLWVMLFGLCALIALESYARTRDRYWLVLMGLMSGFVIGTKYTAGIVLPILGLAISVEWLRRGISDTGRAQKGRVDEGQKPIRDRSLGFRQAELSGLVIDLVIFAGTAFLVFSPWLLKNLVLTGNPLYPFVFSGKGVDELRQLYHSGPTPSRLLWEDLLLPVVASVYGVEQGPGYSVSMGPLILALIPALLIGWRNFTTSQRASLTRLATIAGSTWLIWALSSHVADALSRTRHYFSVFPALAVLSAGGFSGASGIQLSTVRVGRILKALIGLVFGLVLMNEGYAFIKTNPLPVLSGVQSHQAYLEDELGWFGAVMAGVNQLPPDSKIQFLWEPRTYYCDVNCEADAILDRWWHLRRSVGEAQEIATALRAKNITHVLIYDFGARLESVEQPLLTPADWIELERFKQEELILLERFSDIYSLYVLREEGNVP